MARRNGRKGDYLATDDYTGFTVYASKLKRDYLGSYAVRPLLRNLQEIATPLNDPEPVDVYSGPNYEVTNGCIADLAPLYVGLTSVPTNLNNAAGQVLLQQPGIGEASIECTFRVG